MLVKTCLRCNQPFNTNYSFQQYCGSKKGKTGCSWAVQLEQLHAAGARWRLRNPNYQAGWRKALTPEQKEKRNKVSRQFYRGHTERENQLNRERKLRLKTEFVAWLGGKCEQCGYDKALCALDFHHKNPEDKEQEEDWRYKGFKAKVLSNKIALLCANCHREVHHPNGVYQ